MKMENKIKRYDFAITSENDSFMKLMNDGDYVTYEDHQAALSELQKENADLRDKITAFRLSPTSINSDLQKAFDRQLSKTIRLSEENIKLKSDLKFEDFMQAKITQLLALLKMADEGLEFYCNKENWEYSDCCMQYTQHSKITNDTFDSSLDEGGGVEYGGKKARQVRATISDKLKELVNE